MELDPSDWGMMLYCIHAHNQTSLGYRGTIQTLVDDIPVMGPEALIRKLSIDYHILIPLCFPLSEAVDRLQENIKSLATRHNISLDVPTNKPVRRTSSKLKAERESSAVLQIFTGIVNSLCGGSAPSVA